MCNVFQVETCPRCYGQSLCSGLRQGKGTFTGHARFQMLKSILNVKNVYKAKYEDEMVVFKKLAHDAELSDADKHPPPVGLRKNLQLHEVAGFELLSLLSAFLNAGCFL